jgi:hypothetical protein
VDLTTQSLSEQEHDLYLEARLLTSDLYFIMLFTSLILPLVASAAVLQERDQAATNVVVEKLQPQYRKTANRAKYKIGRKYSLTLNLL